MEPRNSLDQWKSHSVIGLFTVLASTVIDSYGPSDKVEAIIFKLFAVIVISLLHPFASIGYDVLLDRYDQYFSKEEEEDS